MFLKDLIHKDIIIFDPDDPKRQHFYRKNHVFVYINEDDYRVIQSLKDGAIYFIPEEFKYSFLLYKGNKDHIGEDPYNLKFFSKPVVTMNYDNILKRVKRSMQWQDKGVRKIVETPLYKVVVYKNKDLFWKVAIQTHKVFKDNSKYLTEKEAKEAAHLALLKLLNKSIK